MRTWIFVFWVSVFNLTTVELAKATHAEPLSRHIPCRMAAGVVGAGDLEAQCRVVSDEPTIDCDPRLSCHDLRAAIRRGCEELQIYEHWICVPFFRARTGD